MSDIRPEAVRRYVPPPTLERLLRLAGPIVAAQMTFFGMHTTDTIIAGRLGANVLAAIAMGGIFLMLGITFLLGFALATAPGVAHRYGAGDSADDIRAFSGSAVTLSVLMWTVWGGLLWVIPPPILELLDLDAELKSLCVSYLQAISWGAPFLGVFFALRNVIEALGHSRPVMWLGVLAFALNIPLDLLFMYGWGPIPAMGAAGCGLASALVDVVMAAGMILLFHRLRAVREFRPRPGLRAEHVREVVGLGLPLSLALSSEHMIFALGGFLMARFGAEVMGANQIALNFTGMMFMIALGLGQASSVLIGQAAGARDGDAVRRAGKLGYQTCATIATGVAVVLLLVPHWIVGIYTQDPAVAKPAEMFLRVAGIFHLFDALQALGAGMLRGLKDTQYVMRATTVAYWGIGGTAIWYFFLHQESAAVVVWYIYLLALAAAALFLGLRFWWQARRFPALAA